MPYDSLIVAAGVEQSYFGHDEFRRLAPGMKTISDALTIRRRVFGAFEMAETAADPAERARWLTFALVGAGPTGVELAGQIRELATKTLREEFRHANPEDCRVLLFDGGTEPLASFGPKLSARTRQALHTLGVELHMGSIVTDVSAGGIKVRDHQGNERSFDAATVLWTAGVAAPPFATAVARATGASQDRSGRIEVQRRPDHPRAPGDLRDRGRDEPAQAARRGRGRDAGRSLRRTPDHPGRRRAAAGRARSSTATWARPPISRAAGRSCRPARLRLSGFLGWVFWLFIHIAFLTGFRNRIGALLTWWVAFTRDVRRERAFTAREVGRLPTVYDTTDTGAGRQSAGQPSGRVGRASASGVATISTNQVLIGIGLIVLIAVGSQVIASRLAIPALIVLLPAGFLAGAFTTDVDPVRLLGPSFQPLVTLAVSVILYDAGLGLNLSKLAPHDRSVVTRLIIFGVTISWAVAAIGGLVLLGLSVRAAVMIGVILVVSGPTVVNPLLAYVRPVARLRRVLSWEGSLIDPVGGILGAVVFHAVSASTRPHVSDQLTQFGSSFAVGIIGGVVGVGVLYLLLAVLRLPEVLGTNVQLAAVVAIAAGCDVVREESGLIAAIVMGLAVSNLAWFDIPARRPFFETLVQLIIGLLFVSIGATISPDSLEDLLLPTAGLVAVLVFVARPVAALISTLGSGMPAAERTFIAWMDPRGIVAAATASAFSASLVAKGVGGAAKILPVTFLVIVTTVALYGLTAKPVARLLKVLEAIRARPLLVGGAPMGDRLGQDPASRRAGRADVGRSRAPAAPDHAGQA